MGDEFTGFCFYMVGNWQGYFVDKRALRGHAAGSKWLIDVNITFQNSGQFTGKGKDDIGPFTFANGKISGKYNAFNSYFTRVKCHGDLRIIVYHEIKK